MDESALTGEPFPRFRKLGDDVLSGSVCLTRSHQGPGRKSRRQGIPVSSVRGDAEGRGVETEDAPGSRADGPVFYLRRGAVCCRGIRCHLVSFGGYIGGALPHGRRGCRGLPLCLGAVRANGFCRCYRRAEPSRHSESGAARCWRRRVVSSMWCWIKPARSHRADPWWRLSTLSACPGRICSELPHRWSPTSATPLRQAVVSHAAEKGERPIAIENAEYLPGHRLSRHG